MATDTVSDLLKVEWVHTADDLEIFSSVWSQMEHKPGRSMLNIQAVKTLCF